ncbi:efflux RND transporter periplasmic adaptor subunit [Janthinobacterium lividum]|uniref:Efflux RND transporter periplasmic adaptor subunit n=1 Tax=Janthinobacterium lividum TaxID=29581 RepID=A0ABU0XMR7_9BURK|nr:efflux RND transporter periplasmic adaptor subunit [Janthinobacterium lividum]MCC7713012.1 efflux RND transporter periplasmic adaptor subunit [Janthinobacterium lividum]MDQ4624295.1 efflux RND transporter periplasmic adaptor subunit [Janthinobacterium lividum]MDQ4674101.1 efflux RND transporter periplasmic adaptor subunit [Janthinobacterium lividum]MDQ4684831.1 efflux RND transporter periplasmic adaptor subunit [Janthinobacterium lividum]OEZ57465.1 multidrug resistance protein MexA precurso
MHPSHLTKKNMLIAAALLSLAACSKPAPEEGAAPPAAVTVLKLQAAPVVLSDELPGRVAAFRTADIRPQVGGIVLRRQFEQGAEVKAGQKLFQLNPAPFQADVDSAAAALQHAVATANRASSQADRLKPLVEADAISRQAYDDAVAQREQAVATVAQARAALARRRLDLAFASIEAPIAGRIGSELVTEGALVGLADATPMARIQQIDKVYVDVRQPAAALAALQASGTGGADKLPVTILGADGQPHPVTGRILFSGISVDAGTGDAVIRVLVDNPQRQLLPGMFVRARIARAVQADGVLLPQQAVLHSSGGQAQAWVLDGTNKASLKPISVGDVIDHQYVVNGGLKAGETVVIEGQERLQPGATAAPQPWKRAAAVAAAPAVSAVR